MLCFNSCEKKLVLTGTTWSGTTFESNSTMTIRFSDFEASMRLGSNTNTYTYEIEGKSIVMLYPKSSSLAVMKGVVIDKKTMELYNTSYNKMVVILKKQ